ncbi:Regulator of G-protein signaling, RGS [Anopheles sinensis]|uniref:Regulator of G-protein signaling, RGS n=1 Tax=Anopheles sinensis TaxID=74873 RepID=A0A084VWH4_ANOSI|nr:Regulator of G-protein signaling, RGS [Anopheles sinensis]
MGVEPPEKLVCLHPRPTARQTHLGRVKRLVGRACERKSSSNNTTRGATLWAKGKRKPDSPPDGVQASPPVQADQQQGPSKPPRQKSKVIMNLTVCDRLRLRELVFGEGTAVAV